MTTNQKNVAISQQVSLDETNYRLHHPSNISENSPSATSFSDHEELNISDDDLESVLETPFLSRWPTNDDNRVANHYPLRNYKMSSEQTSGETRAKTRSKSRNSRHANSVSFVSTHINETEPKRGSTVFRVLLHTTIILLFCSMLYGAYRATLATAVLPRNHIHLQSLVSNGSSLWAPTTLVISIDGFRADYLQRGLTPTLNALIKEGVSPLFMTPPFPSVTFVSHYTMSTGLHPEQHGIVGNTFWDPNWQEEFSYRDPDTSMQSKWWGGEPFWVSAKRQGFRTAIHMWPGSEAHVSNVEMDFLDHFNQSEVLGDKISRVLEWLDLPGPVEAQALAEAQAPRPQLLVTYLPDVDTTGHKYGPNSTETNAAIEKADAMLAGLLIGLEQRNLTDIVNVIVVSDHGMATTSTDRLVQLDDLIDVDRIAHIDGWPLYGLRPKVDSDLEPMYLELKQKTKTMPHLKVYLKDKDMPKSYFFTKNDRIAPLWLVPEAGWAIALKKDFDVIKAKANGVPYSPKGLHGYHDHHPLMRAIFVARGPAFPHVSHSRIESFANINLYNIICDSLGIAIAPNNGTIRLPFKPIGLHSDPDAPKLELPEDFPDFH